MTLRSGDMAVTGRLAAYDGALYVLDTEHGPVSLAASAVTCEGACPSLPRIDLEGDPALVRVLMPALIEAFAARRGLSVSREGDVYRLDDVLLIDLRPAGEDGAALDWGPPDPPGRIGLGPRRQVLALDALVPVVSPRNAAEAVTEDDLARLFAGEVADWSELGSDPAPVSLHLLAGPVGRALEDMLRARNLAPSDAIARHSDPAALARAVASDPGAVGATSVGGIGAARALSLRGPCGIASRPDDDAVRAGDWPLAIPLAATLPAHPMPRLAADLALFATSPEAQVVVRRAGFLDHAPRAVPLAEQGERLAAAILAADDAGALRAVVADLQGLTRLTTTFRFEAGAELDPPSQDATKRLAADIASGVHDGRRLVFVGFGDGTGAPERTLSLSEERARAVLRTVRALAPPRHDGPVLSAVGHGSALPLACDDTATGRRLNRRVELWLR